MEIHFGGTIEIATFQRAIKLAQQPSRTTQATRLLFGGAFVLVLASLVVELTQSQPPDTFRIVRALVLAVFLGYFLARPWLNVQQVTARIARGPQPIQLSGAITDEGFHYQFMQSTQDIRWESILRKRVEPDLIVLLVARGGMFFFPQALFTGQDDWRQFQELVELKVVERKR